LPVLAGAGIGLYELTGVMPDELLALVVRVSKEPAVTAPELPALLVAGGRSLLGVLGPLTLDVVANPGVGAGSDAFAIGVVVLVAAAAAGVLVVEVVAAVLEGAAFEPKAGGAFHLLPLHVSQQLQPVRANPAQTRPSRPTTGVLPIGIPFPCRDETRRA
jgi:hypothetical protein